MNQNLQNIFDVIRQNEKLSEDEKNTLLKSLQDADKELMITAFKLERTEKVKKTTAILLEETIEELEQKRKAVEKQNRELEIESALEKVRTIAMSMRKPDDMLDVCKTISMQLESLGVKEIRNVQTAIFYEHHGTYMNYEFYAKHDKTFITETVFTNNEIHNEFATKMLRGKGEAFITHIKGDEVMGWIAYQKTTNVFIDKYLETASSLNYYWFSLGPVALGISTYHPLTEEEINLFKRFLKVFELAYQRYLDIEKAEAQAREAQIELALERVRTRSMIMQKSDELSDAAQLLYQEFGKLGVNTFTCGYMFIDEIRNTQTAWMVLPDGTLLKNFVVFPLTGDHVLDGRYEDWKAKKPLHTYEIRREVNKEHHRFLSIHVPPFVVEEFFSKMPDPVVFHCANFSEGYLLILATKLLSQEDQQTIIRFARVFEMTYTRFLDLQKAEAQAREAQIEAALERIRSAAMAMRNSSALSELIYKLYGELTKLDAKLDRCFIMIVNSENHGITWWLAGKEGLLAENGFFIQMNQHPSHLMYLECWEKRKKKWQYLFEGKEKRDWDSFGFSNTELARLPEFIKKDMAGVKKIHLSGSSDQFGLLVTGSSEPLPEEQHDIISRFTIAFNQAFIRFLDLQKAEAQAREAQIELALERVRARTMAMQKSDELKEVVASIFDGMKSLGVDPTVCNIALVDRKTCDTDVWTAHQTDNGMITYKVYISHFEHPFRKKLLDSFLNEIPFSVHELSGDLKKSYAQYLNEHVDYSNVPAEVTKSNEELANMEGGIVLSAAYMKYGLLIVSRNHAISNDESDILQRFAKIFEQTYTRFLDLQKAEAQAREAKIEASMEKIRSRSLAMQKPDELVEVAELLRKEMGLLGVEELETSSIYIVDKENQQAECWYAIKDIREENKRLVSDEMTLTLSETWVGNEMWKFYRSKKEQASIVMKGENRKEWINYCADKSQVLQGYYGNEIPERTYHLVKFNGGYMGAASPGYISSESWDLLKRAAVVFSLAYTRFKDLQDAEARAREAQIEAALERVRSRTMGMQKSVELKDVIRVVYEQFVHLKINVDHAGFVVDYTPKGDWHFWIADEQDIPSKITHPYFESVWANQFNEAKEKGADIFATNLNFEEKNKFYDELLSYVPGLPEASKDFYLSCPGLAATTVLFDNVSLYVENFSGIPYTDEENNMLMRFGKVFQQTYTRFLDLQKAEAQARESQIEASLERVRSKALAMHSPNDLSETVNVFFKELKTLGIIPIRCGVGQIDEATRTTSLTTTTSSQQGESFRVIGKVKQTGHPVLDGIFEHWKLQKEYHPVLQGEDIKAYYNVMNAQIGYPEYPEEVTQYGNSFPFKEGFVFAWTENLLSEEELIIFRRFTLVLSLTYRRYLDLKEAEERNKIIQAENDRKTKELEEARQLQLAMLPKSIPELPNLDIAVYMKTATEVGGDYYDFNVQENGILNIGFGDATGHGLQAGTMITLMKGFFASNVAKFNPQEFLEHCNVMIRDIKLGRILMSFSHLRFENSRLLISSAGMPPIYYFHKINNRTEEIIIQGLPLGALQSTSYKLVEKKLNTGDTILLLTDGLPEQMNSQKVIFDYSRVLKYFDEIAGNSPQEIINRLVEKADDWMNGQQQSDDITFVVIRVL